MHTHDNFSLEDIKDSETEEKITTYHKDDKKSFYIYDNIVKLYGENFIVNYDKIVKHIIDFINSKSEILYNKNPGAKMMFSDTMINAFYLTVGVEKIEIKKIIKGSNDVHETNTNHNNPFYTLLMVMISFYYKNRNGLLKKIYEKMKMNPHELINLFLTMKVYSAAQSIIIHHEPKKSLVDYTINKLNDRFEIYKAKNMFEIIERYAKTNFESKLFYIENPTDYGMPRYVDKLYTRFKSFFKKIMGKLMEYKNEHRSTQVERLELVNSEGDNYLNSVDNVSADIENISKKVTNTFCQDSVIKKTNLNIACSKTGVNSVKMEQILISIREGKDRSHLLGIIKHIIAYWLVSKGQTVQTIHSKEFIQISFSAFKVSNTRDVHILEIKNLLDLLLKEYSEEYLKTERKATLSNFKQCLYIYLIFYIASTV